MALSAKDKAETKDKLLDVMAGMVSMPLPQQAMVLGHMIGSFVAAAMASKGMTEREATDFILDQMEAQIQKARPH